MIEFQATLPRHCQHPPAMHPQPCQPPSLEPELHDLGSETGEVDKIGALDYSVSPSFLVRRHCLDELFYHRDSWVNTSDFYGSNIVASQNYPQTGIGYDSLSFAPSPTFGVPKNIFPTSYMGNNSLNTNVNFFPLENFPGPDVYSSQDSPLTSKAIESYSISLSKALASMICGTAFNEPLPGAPSPKQHRHVSHIATNRSTSWSSDSTSQCNHHISTRTVQRDAIVNRVMTNATPRILDAIENEMMRLDPDSLNLGKAVGKSKL